MDRVNVVKKVMKYVWIVWGVFSILVLFHFLMHGIRVNKYNEKNRKLTPTSITTEAELNIHPRGQMTDSWEKDDAFPDKLLYAKIYEATVVNRSGSTMTNWDIRIQMKEDCYLNSSWCGTVEVHQFLNGGELTQTIDLRDYDRNKITLNHFFVGQDLMIILHKNDYIIYHPNKKASIGERPLRSTADYAGEVNVGFIMYNEREETDLSDYVLHYRLHKSLFSGTVGNTFAVLLSLSGLLFLFMLFLSLIILRFEGKISFQERVMEESLHLCAALGDSKSVFSNGHSQRVAHYSKILAESVGMDENDSEIVYRAALLHDIGNYYVPDQILSKPTELSKEEMEIVKTHTTKGAQIVADMETTPYVMETVLFHHEWYNGEGYPMGKVGEEIPLIARIVSVAEAYDAMSHHRPYRKKLKEEQIFDELEKMREKQFDPAVVDAFFDGYERIKGVE
ncbi:HDIG domain-containing protein [Lachnospiraceae bacterium XBB1006]|nr:HDIG domain-containing protein [Lachnospiraceae bacterium XBB1006]